MKDLAAFLPGDRPADLWDGLASPDPAHAYGSFWTLLQKNEDAVALLGQRLVAEKGEEIRRFLPDLGSDVPEVRDRAAAALGRIGSEAVPVLKQAVRDAGSLDVRSRLEAIIATYGGSLVRALGVLRRIRSIQALEAIGNAGAIKLLQRVRHDLAGTREAAEADRSLKRLGTVGR